MRIVAMTATRADYPRCKEVLKEIINCNFDLKLVVTGSHLSKKFGNSISEILKDKIPIHAKIKILHDNFNTHLDMAKSMAKLSNEFAKILDNLKPDLVLLTVDRFETLACASIASVMNFPIAHIQGGEVTGTVDESIRHAVSKLSHLHFVANKDAQKRLIKLGEERKFVFNVGCPFIDVIKETKLLNKKELFKKFQLSLSKKTILFVQHPVTTEYLKTNNHIEISLKAISSFKNVQIISIMSNFDAGSNFINKKISKLKKKITFIPNLNNEIYLSFLKNVDVMVGNSSSAVREAPSFRLPCVNIGSRQNGRLMAKNVINVDNELSQIIKAINKSLYNEKFKNSLKTIKNPYGNGNSSKKILKILKEIDLSNITQKKITY